MDNLKFNAFYTEYYKRLFSRAYYLTQNRQDAEDLVDEAFLVYARKSLTTEIYAPRSYIFEILAKLIGNYLKSQRRERAIFLSLESMSELSDEADGLHRPLADLLPKELALWEMEILTLRYEKNLSYEEISSILGLEPVSCRSRLFRAKLHCRDLLDKLIQEKKI